MDPEMFAGGGTRPRDSKVSVMKDASEWVIADEFVRNNSYHYLVNTVGGVNLCELVFNNKGIITECGKRGTTCSHVLPAVEMGIGVNHVEDLRLENLDVNKVFIPLFRSSNDDLISTQVTVQGKLIKNTVYGEVVVATTLGEHIGKNTQLFKATGKMSHSVGLVGEGDSYKSIKTMLSAWCQAMANDMNRSAKGAHYSDWCTAPRHINHKIADATDHPTDIFALIITGQCARCRGIARAKTTDVPPSF